eukprot:TRINITY_DN1021_c0_g1_i2.p1 TRINITY_DN1021_c0_g1~~TRINITY_DN1021_c0_g1_i2.p1  ORF type:complete len:726 (+),score=192.87 TRINITY_DN1021_c0_g1_i2:84-2261(+)
MHLNLFAFVFVATFTSILGDTCLRFAVVAPGATSVKVSVGGSTYDLTAAISGVPYFNGTVSVASVSDLQYHYIANGTAESFERTFPSGRSKTYNDFLGRQETTKSLVQLGNPFTENSQWTRALGPNGVYDDDYISTVWFSGDVAASLFAKVDWTPSSYGVTVTMINKDDVGHWTDVIVDCKDGEEAKIAIKMMLPYTYHGRSVYKLRPSVYDPTFIREKIYNDMLQATGCPHQESSFARVYVNDKGLGVYHLQEMTASWDFITTQFYGSGVVAQPAQLGVPLDASTGADFAPASDSSSFNAPSGYTNEKIEGLKSALAALDVSSDAAMATFNQNWFSIDHFLRAAALEYLTGHWDSYWFFTTNFVVYNDPTEGSAGTSRFYFIDQDFDQTFGVGMSDSFGDPETFPVQPYTKYVNKVWNLDDYDGPTRQMIDRLLANPSTKTKFETIIKTIVKEIMNPNALNRRIDAVAQRIRPDLAWDRGLGANRARQPMANAESTPLWTIKQTDDNLNTSVDGNWGFKSWVQSRANYIKQSMGITFTSPPLEGSRPGSPATNGGTFTCSSSSSPPASVTTKPLTTATVTTKSLTTAQVTTKPLTTAASPASPVTTSPLTTSPVTTAASPASPVSTSALTTSPATTQSAGSQSSTSTSGDTSSSAASSSGASTGSETDVTSGSVTGTATSGSVTSTATSETDNGSVDSIGAEDDASSASAYLVSLVALIVAIIL